MPYSKFYDPWHNADAATGGGDTSTPLTAAALDHIETGVFDAAATADAAIPESIVDAKGDLIVGSAADAVVRKAVGADNAVLAASAGDTGGVTWKKVTNDMVDAAAAIARTKLAAKTTRLPIQLHTARTASLAGNAFWSVLALTNYDFGHWEFVKDVEGKVYGSVIVPPDIAATPSAKIVLVLAASATSGVTRMQVSTAPPADGETLNVTFTAETAQDVTVPGTIYFRKDVTFTLTNAPAASDILIVEVFHDGDHANDTLAVNTLLLGAYLEVDVT